MFSVWVVLLSMAREDAQIVEMYSHFSRIIRLNPEGRESYNAEDIPRRSCRSSESQFLPHKVLRNSHFPNSYWAANFAKLCMYIYIYDMEF
jgi:hypothetical protein